MENPAVEITGIAAGGDGVGLLPDGRVAFVPRTAPGDRVQVVVTRDTRRWVRARIVALASGGPDRRTAPCPLYETCGGCHLQHLDYEAQLRAKGRIVADTLQRVGGLKVASAPRVGPAPQAQEYRNRVSFTLRRLGAGRVVAGFHTVLDPARLVDVPERCLLAEERVNLVWHALRAAWGGGARRLPPGRELRLTLRGAGDGAVLSIEGGSPGGDAPGLLAATPGLAAIWHRPKRSGWRRLAGPSDVKDEWLEGPIAVGAGAFRQVSRWGAETLRDRVLREVGDPRGLSVLDAYAGIGGYARILAASGGRVVAIEADPAAVRVARAGAPPGLTVLEGRVEDHVAQVLPVDRAILNPPRTGLRAAVAGALRAHPPARLVYVSCDPATLARDLARLVSAYRIRDLAAFDLFPQTAHVETVVTLERTGREAPASGARRR